MPVRSCIEAHPSRKTVWLGGVPINLTAAARIAGIGRSYLSKLINCADDPLRMSLEVALHVSAGLGMSLDEFIEAIYERAEKAKMDAARTEVFLTYIQAQEHAKAMKNARKGLPAPPTIPLVGP